MSRCDNCNGEYDWSDLKCESSQCLGGQFVHICPECLRQLRNEERSFIERKEREKENKNRSGKEKNEKNENEKKENENENGFGAHRCLLRNALPKMPQKKNQKERYLLSVLLLWKFF